ncbi:MAG: NACHT domain-containing protein [Magnetococcales bacterium]|nr:NACHT domain-containing protein [Magnetococcales bacterium]
MPDAKHIPILALDIAGFTTLERSQPHRRTLLKHLKSLMEDAGRFFMGEVMSVRDVMTWHGTGDGGYLAFTSPIPHPFHITLKYVLTLIEKLDAHNQQLSDPNLRLHVRIVLVVGDVESASDDYLADAFTEAKRLLDHPPFKDYLKAGSDDAVIALSALFHDELRLEPEPSSEALRVAVPQFTPFRIQDKHGIFHDALVAGTGWTEPELDEDETDTASEPEPYRIIMLTGHSLDDPLPEAVDMMLVTARKWQQSGLNVEVRLDLATANAFKREGKRGWDLLIFYGHGDEAGRLKLADGSWLGSGDVDTTHWKQLKAAILFACHAQLFATDLPCPWVAFDNTILRKAPPGFITAWIEALSNQPLDRAAEHAKQLAESDMASEFVDHIAFDDLPDCRFQPGQPQFTHLCAILDKQSHFYREFSTQQRVKFLAEHDPFEGRREILRDLLDLPSLYGDGDRQQAFWIHGPASIGKSALLRQTATLAAETVFFDQETPLYIVHVSCVWAASVADLQDRLLHGLSKLFGDLPKDLDALCTQLAERPGRHLWILDDLTYIADQPDLPSDSDKTKSSPHFEREDARRFLQTLLSTTREAALVLQLVVSSRRPPDSGGPWYVHELKPLVTGEALSLARNMAHLYGGGSSVSYDDSEINQGARRLFQFVRGATGLYKRSLHLAMDQGRGFIAYADDLEKYGLQMDQSDEPMGLAKEMIGFELEQLDSLSPQKGFSFRQFLTLCQPLVLRVGTFTADELAEWFDDQFIPNQTNRPIPLIYRQAMDHLVKLGFLFRLENGSYGMPPNQRLPLLAIHDPDFVFSTKIPWRNVQERLSQAMELLKKGNIQQAIAAFEILAQDYDQYLDETPETALAVFRSMNVQAQVALHQNNDPSSALSIFGQLWSRYQ